MGFSLLRRTPRRDDLSGICSHLSLLRSAPISYGWLKAIGECSLLHRRLKQSGGYVAGSVHWEVLVGLHVAKTVQELADHTGRNDRVYFRVCRQTSTGQQLFPEALKRWQSK
jgi:hypothetical protein